MEIDFSNRELYNTKYIPLLRENRRYVFMLGGRGSGKSMFQAQKEIIKTFEKWNRLLAVRKVKDTLKESCYAELRGIIELWKLEDYFTCTVSPLQITNNLTGSDIVFRGLDYAPKIKSIKWVSRVWAEEATELTKSDFNYIDASVRGKQNMQITCTFNPDLIEHWINQEFWQNWENNDVCLLHTTFFDNKWIGPEFQTVMDRLKNDINAYNMNALGLWGTNKEGLVYEYENIQTVPENAKFLWYGLDFGYNHPAVLVGLYEWNDSIIIDEEFYKSWMINSDIVDFLKEKKISPSADIIADNSRPEAIEEIYRWGFNCRPCKKWPDSVINGILAIKWMKLLITSRSTGVKKDFNNYIWAKDKNGKPLKDDSPIKAFDDGPDAVRYGLSYYFNFKEFDITFW